jgi:hypothetical protein
MKNRRIFFSAAIVAGGLTLGGVAFGADGVVLREALSAASNYCHLQFPAIREDTLATGRPLLKSPAAGDLIDFYGPCDEDPLGPNQVRLQRQDLKRRAEIDRMD